MTTTDTPTAADTATEQGPDRMSDYIRRLQTDPEFRAAEGPKQVAYRLSHGFTA